MREVKPPKIELDDTVICRPTSANQPVMLQVMSAEYHTGYGQWLFNKGDKLEFYERQIIYYYHPKKLRFIKYA